MANKTTIQNINVYQASSTEIKIFKSSVLGQKWLLMVFIFLNWGTVDALEVKLFLATCFWIVSFFFRYRINEMNRLISTKSTKKMITFNWHTALDLDY